MTLHNWSLTAGKGGSQTTTVRGHSIQLPTNCSYLTDFSRGSTKPEKYFKGSSGAKRVGKGWSNVLQEETPHPVIMECVNADVFQDGTGWE